MEPMYLQIQQKETGRQIKKLLVENGYTVKDVQNAMGFENPQAVYKWISGRSLPSLDNFVILSRLLHTSIEDILVIDGDIVRLFLGFQAFFGNNGLQTDGKKCIMNKRRYKKCQYHRNEYTQLMISMIYRKE